MTRVELGDLGVWGSGGTPLSSRTEFYNGDIPWLIIEDLNDSVVTKSLKSITKLGLENSSAKIVEAGTLLIAMYGSIGKLGIAGFRCATNQAIAFCKLNSSVVDTRFVFEYLKYMRPQLLQAGRGGTQQNINQEILKEFPIPLPSLEEQRRIAGILERADRLRRLRLHALEISDTYLQSVFLEMFGDPSSIAKGWESYTLRELSAKFSDGPFGSNLKSEHYRLEGVRVWRLQNIGINALVDDDKAFISLEHFQTISRHKCEPGDVIIGTMGDPNLRAFIQPNNIDVAVNKADCIQFRPNTKLVTGQYICQLMNMPQTLTLAGEMIHGQTRARISMGSLAELRIPLPPLELQRKFARVVQRHERLRAQQLEGVRLAQGLYDALLHDAFSG